MAYSGYGINVYGGTGNRQGETTALLRYTLVEIYLDNETLYISTDDIYYNDLFYINKLMQEPVIPEIADKVGASEVTLVFSNSADKYFISRFQTAQFRNKLVKIRKIDNGKTQVIAGYITTIDIGGDNGAKTIIKVRLRYLDELQTVLPSKLLEESDSDNVPEIDIGKPFSIIFGYAKDVPCLYVFEDTTNDYYDYIIGYGELEACDKVYRDGVEINSSEYDFYDGSQSSPYGGYAYLRFTSEQKDYNDRLYTISADVKGLKMGGANAERNFITIIKNILTNTTWGLGISVDERSFDDEAKNISDLKCDGAVYSKQKTFVIINDLLFCAKSILIFNDNALFAIKTHSWFAAPEAFFGSGDDNYENIISINELKKRNTDKVTKRLLIEYQHNRAENEYAKRSTAVLYDFGEERVLQLGYVRDDETAERILYHNFLKEKVDDETIKLTVGTEGNSLQRDSIIELNIPRLNINNLKYQVHKINKTKTGAQLSLASYNIKIFSAGSPVGVPIVDYYPFDEGW